MYFVPPCISFLCAVVVDDQLAKYMALVAQERESKGAAQPEAVEAAYSEAFESSREDSFAAGPGFGGVDAARNSATPTHTPSGTRVLDVWVWDGATPVSFCSTIAPTPPLITFPCRPHDITLC